jgi:hypothetical protein
LFRSSPIKVTMTFRLHLALTSKTRCLSLGIFALGLLVLGGCSTQPTVPANAAKADDATRPRVEDVPQPAFGIATVSVACGRENPGHKSELGTQVLLGHSVRVWKKSGSWYEVETRDGYRAWLELGTFELYSAEAVDRWRRSNLAIVTALETVIREKPDADSDVVSDAVIGCLVERMAQEGSLSKVGLPDGRQGYVPASSIEVYADWQKSRRPTAEAIEATARQFLGRPYMWGGNSPKALDCSGFTQLVFLLNGTDLPRNASQQAGCGTPVTLTSDLSHLQQGDLLFFGRPAGSRGPARVTHTGIYLGNGSFIHSYDRVQISRLGEPQAGSENQRRRLPIAARRVLPHLP